MKNSLTSTDCMDTSHTSGNTGNVLLTTLRAILSRLDHMGSALAIGEAGDLDAAQALRERNV